jgi:hypothetical protein
MSNNMSNCYYTPRQRDSRYPFFPGIFLMPGHSGETTTCTAVELIVNTGPKLVIIQMPQSQHSELLWTQNCNNGNHINNAGRCSGRKQNSLQNCPVHSITGMELWGTIKCDQSRSKMFTAFWPQLLCSIHTGASLLFLNTLQSVFLHPGLHICCFLGPEHSSSIHLKVSSLTLFRSLLKTNIMGLPPFHIASLFFPL